jgi:hypothetical protein
MSEKGQSPQVEIDIERLADLVYRLLLAELRLAAARSGGLTGRKV